MKRKEIFARTVVYCSNLTARYFPGFDDSNHTRNTAELPNHFAWILGHSAITMHHLAMIMQGGAVPESDFIPLARTGDNERYGADSVGTGSEPISDPSAYPKCARCIEIFDSASRALAAAIRQTHDARFDLKVKWGEESMTLGALITRVIFHNGVHCGQIVDLRRALKLPPIKP